MLARFVRIDRLHRCPAPAGAKRPESLTGARAYYDEQRDRGLDHNAALRALSNRLASGSFATGSPEELGTPYDEATAWSHRVKIPSAA